MPGTKGHAIGIDPGVLALGFAVACDGGIWSAGCAWESRLDGNLAARGVRFAREIHNHYETIDPVVFLESMTATEGRATTAQDLINVQTVGCLTAGALIPGRIVLLTPAEWKGSTPKPIHHERMIETLDSCERAILREALESTPAKHHKEVLDAVGILMYGLGRIERTGAARKAGA